MTTLTSQQAPRLSFGVQVIGLFVLAATAVAAGMLTMSLRSASETGSTFSVPPVEQAIQSRSLNDTAAGLTRTQAEFGLGSVAALRSLNRSEAGVILHSAQGAIDTRTLNRSAAPAETTLVKRGLARIGQVRALNHP